MSNALHKKKKPIFLGYTNKETRMVFRKDAARCSANRVVIDSYKDFLVIGYQVLHDKFGFALKRITRCEKLLNEYTERADDDMNMSSRAMAFLLEDKWKIDVVKEVEKVNQNHFVQMYFNRNTPITINDTRKLVKSTLFNYFSYIMVVLKTNFKFSVNDLNRFMDSVRDYIDTLARYDQFGLTIPMIVETIAEETKYVCDWKGAA